MTRRIDFDGSTAEINIMQFRIISQQKPLWIIEVGVSFSPFYCPILFFSTVIPVNTKKQNENRDPSMKDNN